MLRLLDYSNKKMLQFLLGKSDLSDSEVPWPENREHSLVES